MKMKHKKDKKNKKNKDELAVCTRCGAIATDKDQLCKPDRFSAEEGCTITEKGFGWFPSHGNCQPVNYVCAKCGKEALSDEYLCEGEPVKE
jgi:DNA-directed RNA polymerase subunit RPC12/RpoP